MKPSHFLVETTLIGHRQRDFFCFSIMNQTSAMVHAMLFQAQAFNDVLQQAPYMYSHVARYHLSKALEILQKRLNDEKTATEVSTMIIVTSLATAGIFLGDMESSRKHMDGLYQMVTLAGGLEALGHGTMVEHKAQRYSSPYTLQRDIADKSTG